MNTVHASFAGGMGKTTLSRFLRASLSAIGIASVHGAKSRTDHHNDSLLDEVHIDGTPETLAIIRAATEQQADGGAKAQYMALRAVRKGLVLDQLAFYARDEFEAAAIKSSLGLSEADWTQDTVTGTAVVWGREPTFSKALLQFNYDLGIEVEILTYLEGPHWHEETVARQSLHDAGFVSHIGFHVNDGELPDLPFPVAQELITETHNNPGTLGRKYHYRIFDARSTTGSYLKYIKRVL